MKWISVLSIFVRMFWTLTGLVEMSKSFCASSSYPSSSTEKSGWMIWGAGGGGGAADMVKTQSTEEVEVDPPGDLQAPGQHL